MEAFGNQKIFVLVNPEDLEGNLFNDFISEVITTYKADKIFRKLVILTSMERNLKEENFFLENTKDYFIKTRSEENHFLRELKIYNKGSRWTSVISSLLLDSSRQRQVVSNQQGNCLRRPGACIENQVLLSGENPPDVREQKKLHKKAQRSTKES